MLVDTGKLDILNTIIAGAAGYRVGLYKAKAAALAHDTVIANLTECDYSGYARQTPAYGAPALDGGFDGVTFSPDLTFSHNGGAVPNAAIGFFLINQATGKLIAVTDFPAAKTMAAGGDSIIISPGLLDGAL